MIQKKIFIPYDLTSTYEFDNEKILHTCSHADLKIRKRKISIAEIIETFRNPDQRYPNKRFSNANNYVKRFGERQLKIGVKDDEEPYVVITVFYI